MSLPPDRPAPDDAAAGAPPVARRGDGVGAGTESGGTAAAEAHLRPLLEWVCERVRLEVGADYAALGTTTAGGEHRWLAATGIALEAWDRRAFPLAGAVARQALERRAATWLRMPEPTPADLPQVPERVQSAVAIPVGHGTDAPTGTLMLGWRSVWPPSSKDVALAQQYNEQSWLLLEIARLIEEVVALRQSTEQARVRAEASEHAKGMFLATMSHEIRTPLNAVLGYAELLELEIDGPLTEAQRDRLARLRRTGHHLLTLVTGILDVAKVEAGEMSVRREVADLREALSDALAAVVPQATAAGLVLNDECGERIPVRYVGDPDRVRQILVNLLSNAVKFTPRGGWVTISCRSVPHAEIGENQTASGPWLRVDVADTGIGIPVARQQLIFDPFVQGHAAHERAAAGTGLGLTISRRLARLMGGEITLVSAPGAGSRFSLWLPAE